jgi:hypothetical protein
MDGFEDGFEGSTAGNARFYSGRKDISSQWAQGSPILASREKKYYEIAESCSWKSMAGMTSGSYSREVGFYNRQAVLDISHEGRGNRNRTRKEFQFVASQLGEERWVGILKSGINWSLSHGNPQN